MAETIESFVEKLQNEGIEAGESQAARIREEAQAQAQRIISEAEEQASQIIKHAESKADETRQKGDNELKLAVRDAVMRLRATLEGALQSVMAGPVEEKLRDTEFLGKLLHDLVMQYVQADCIHHSDIDINVPPELQKPLADWAIRELRKQAREQAEPPMVKLKGNLAEKAGQDYTPHAQSKTHIDLHGTLSQAGFEYKVSGGTVEVTVDSVVATLSKLVSPKLREMLQEKTSSESE